jgi:transposase
MASKTHELNLQERRMRRFSENFKREKVKEVELGYSTATEISSQYQVTRANVHRWIRKFGTMNEKKSKLIIESESDTKQLLELKKKVAELERIIGQKQILIDFKDKMIELAEEEYRVDIKKKYSTQHLPGSGKTKDS